LQGGTGECSSNGYFFVAVENNNNWYEGKGFTGDRRQRKGGGGDQEDETPDGARKREKTGRFSLGTEEGHCRLHRKFSGVFWGGSYPIVLGGEKKGSTRSGGNRGIDSPPCDEEGGKGGAILLSIQREKGGMGEFPLRRGERRRGGHFRKKNRAVTISGGRLASSGVGWERSVSNPRGGGERGSSSSLF